MSAIARGRAVLVNKKLVDNAVSRLGNILRMDKVPEKLSRRRRFERPTEQRRRLEAESCRRIYRKGMQAKLDLLFEGQSTKK